MYSLSWSRTSENALYKLLRKEFVEAISSHSNVPKFSKKLVDSPHNQVSSSINRLNMDKIVNRADAVIKSNRIVSFNSCKTEKC